MVLGAGNSKTKAPADFMPSEGLLSGLSVTFFSLSSDGGSVREVLGSP